MCQKITWSKAHPERMRVLRLKWRRNNPEKERDRKKRYRLENAEKVRLQERTYKHRNAERVKHRMELWRDKNKEHLREYKRQARIKNPEKHRFWGHNNRLRRGEAPIGNVEQMASWEKRWRKRRFVICFWCRKRRSPNECDSDHIIALAKGGANSIENLCISCHACNLRKHSKTIPDWNLKLQEPILL